MPDVRIRFLEPEDAVPLYEAARESIEEIFPWMAWCHADYQLHESEEWIATQLEARTAAETYTFAIIGEDERFLGSCGLSQINPLHHFANLGYWVRTSATGRGVASQAVKALATWAFENTTLERLEIVVAVENKASQRAAEKANAKREGIAHRRLLAHNTFHDATINSILRPRTQTT